jgi:hypothetical protein
MRWTVVILGKLFLTTLLSRAELRAEENALVEDLPPVTLSDYAGDAARSEEFLFPLPPLDPTTDQQTYDQQTLEMPRPVPRSNSRASAFDSLGLGKNGGPGYGATWYPTASRGGTDVSLVRQHLSGGMPVWKDGGDAVMLTLGVKNSLYDTNAIMPESLQPFPEELWNITLGAMFLRKFDNGASGMISINVGSASNQPFHSIDEMTVGFISMLQVPARNERDKWQYMLIYSPVGNFNFPVPGIAYQWNPSETFQASIGLPFSLKWRPAERWLIELSYLPVLTVNAKATFLWTDDLSLYGGFESFQETYLLANRIDNDDRFVGFEQRLIGGLRWNAWTKCTLDCHAGYAFDRYFGTGQNQIGGSLEDRVDFPSGAFVGANFLLRF